MYKIAVGCGKRNYGPDWYHVDGEKYPHVVDKDVFLNCFEIDSVDIIYASHFLEYMDREEAAKLLKQWHYVLRPGGILRLAVPDFDKLIIAIRDCGFTLDDILGPLFGRMKMNDKWIYHKTVYNHQSLNKILLTAGFKEVVRYDWRNTEHAHIDDQSRAYLPHDPEAIRTGNFNKHILISLNVEATK